MRSLSLWLARLIVLILLVSSSFLPCSGSPQGAVTKSPPVPLDAMIRSMLASANTTEELRAKYAANEAVLFEYPVSRVTVYAFIQAIQANAQSLSDDGSYDIQSGHIAALAEDFIKRLGPEQSFAVPDFVQMATASRVGLQRIAFLALTRIGEIPEKFTPLLMQHLKDHQYYWAERALIALGPKASTAVPELMRMLENSNLSQMTARVLTAIGRPAADPALPVMTRIAGSLPPQLSSALFESLLALEPKSKIAQEGLEKLAVAKETALGNRLYAHGLLLKSGHDASTHLKSLRDALKDPDPETRSIAARLILENSDNRPARKEAADEAIRLVESDTRDPAYRAADGLRQLGPADRDMAPKLIEAIRKLAAGMNRGGPSIGYTSYMVAWTITGLARLGTAAKAGVPLLESLTEFVSSKPNPPLDSRIRDAASLALRSIR